jgi:hypothetical protein
LSGRVGRRRRRPPSIDTGQNLTNFFSFFSDFKTLKIDLNHNQSIFKFIDLNYFNPYLRSGPAASSGTDATFGGTRSQRKYRSCIGLF